MSTQAPILAALALTAMVLVGCDSGAAVKTPEPKPDARESGGSGDEAGGSEAPADFAGEPDGFEGEREMVETKIRVGGMVITRRRPRYAEDEKRKKIKVVKEPDADLNFPYRNRGEKGEHLDRRGKIRVDEKGKPLKMH